MKVPLLVFVLLGIVSAWSAVDYEIFELNDLVKRDLGQGVTFYSWLGLEKGPKSLWEEINQAYRKLSRKIHPDKVRVKSVADKKVKRKAEQRYQRLSVVGSILRDGEQRERYNYFLDKGFPKKTTTGYLYSKVRPGTVLVFVVLYVVFGAFQMVALKINHTQDQKRMQTMIELVKRVAFPNGTRGDFSERRVGSGADEKEFVVTFDGSVYLLDPSDKLTRYLLDPQAIDAPSWRDTMWVSFPRWVWNFTAGRLESLRWHPREPRAVGLSPTEAKIVEVDEPEVNANEEAREKRRNRLTEGVRRLPNGKVVGKRKE